VPPRPDRAPTRGVAAGRAALVATAALLAAALAPSAPAVAQQQRGGSGGGEPVEIVSDSLTVEQERRLATFTGNVDAVQGDLRLRADKLLVYYDQGGDDGQGQAAQPAAGQGSIRRIEAVGNVLVVQPGETAKGDRGTYEPATGAMTLEGDVVLTRGQNVIRGARLESNERTGVSTVFAAAPGAVRQPGQRVRALFTRQAADRQQGQAAPGRERGGAAVPARPPAAGAAAPSAGGTGKATP
jgi:lipopolysaccharide export system protein LptA